MIRWVFLLLVALALTLGVLGQDRGQRRAGLANAPAVQLAAAATAPTPAPVPAPVAAPKPVPAKPAQMPAPVVGQPLARRIDPVTPTALATAMATVMATAPATALASPPDQPAGAAPSVPAPTAARLITTEAVNMRSGAGRTYGVLASLQAGAPVEVLGDDAPASGWRHVRSADGIEGFVAARMVTAAP